MTGAGRAVDVARSHLKLCQFLCGADADWAASAASAAAFRAGSSSAFGYGPSPDRGFRFCVFNVFADQWEQG